MKILKVIVNKYEIHLSYTGEPDEIRQKAYNRNEYFFSLSEQFGPLVYSRRYESFHGTKLRIRERDNRENKNYINTGGPRAQSTLKFNPH